MRSDPAPRPLTFTDGIGTGIAAMAVVTMLWIGHAGGQLAAMMKELASPPSSLATRLALSAGWRWGLPPAVVAVFAYVLLVRRPDHRLAILALGLVAVALAVGTYVAQWRPLWAVAGAIE